MSRALSGSPPYRNNGFMTIPPKISPHPYLTPSNVLYYEQMCQHVNIVNPYEGGLENSGWYPQNYNPNSQTYYQPGQQGFGVPLPLLGYSTNPNYNPNYYDDSVGDGSPPCDAYKDRGEYPPTHWKPSLSQHIAVPLSSSLHSIVDPVNQSQLLSGPSVLRKSASITQPKRHRAPTFPGANPPNLSFFEGSKKSSWRTRSSNSCPDSQQSEEQIPSSTKRDNHAPVAPISTHRILRGNSPKANDNRRLVSSQDGKTLGGPMKNMRQQPYRGPYQGICRQENQYPYRSNERSPPEMSTPYFAPTRKLHYVRPSMIESAIPKISWVERGQSIAERVNSNENFDCYPEPLSSIGSASLSPASTSAGMAKSSPPLIVTSTLVAVTSIHEPSRSASPNAEESFSQCAVDESRFMFNPRAKDFVLAQKLDPSESSKVDEYVGFYLNPKVTPFSPETIPTTLFTYDCGPMAWQVPNTFASETSQSLKSSEGGDFLCSNQSHSYRIENPPKEFFGKVPNNMNWEKKPLPAVKEQARTNFCTNLGSEDKTKVMDTITKTRATTPSDERQRVGVVSEVVGSYVIPVVKNQKVADVKLSYDIGNKLPVKDTQGVLFSETTQTSTKTLQFPGSSARNTARFPECFNLQPTKKFTKAKIDAEQVINIRVLSDGGQPFEDVELVVRPLGCTMDEQLGVKLFDQAEDVETAESDVGEQLQQPLHDTEATKNKPEPKKKSNARVKSKKVKCKAKPRNKPELGSEARIDVVPDSLPELKTELQHQINPNTKLGVKPQARFEVSPQVERLLQKSVPNSGNEIELKADDEPETRGEFSPMSRHETKLKAEDKLHPKDTSSFNLSSIPDSVMKDAAVRVFNYRDALLTKVANPQTSIAPSPKIVHPRIVSQRATISKGVGQQSSTKVDPLLDIGSRRKFFLHPIPTTATYDSVIRQLKGGMLEDIYISGLSPHPSAWKGPRGEPRASRGVPHDNNWYGHVSFYSKEGASKFWELVQSGKECVGPYQSRYGGFDDQQPGFFVLDGVRVFVNWRHNDQRAVNTLTMKAVTEENATRCLLLTFNTEFAFRNQNMAPFLSIKMGSEKDYELAFIKKVSTDIETWGQADSNLQGIRLFDETLESKKEIALDPTPSCFTSKLPPKQVKLLISFIKLLTAAKIKKFFSGRPEYGQNGFCKVEYYKDECDEPIDTFKAIREATFLAAKERSSEYARQTTPDTQIRKYLARTASKKGVSGEEAVVETTVKVGDAREDAVKRRESIVKEEEKGLGGNKISQSTQEKPQDE